MKISPRILQNLIILGALAVGCSSDTFPSSVPRCKYADNVCIVSVMNKIIKASGIFPHKAKYTAPHIFCQNLAKNLAENGLPELGLVATGPYEISDLTVEKGDESPINIKIHYKRANISGIYNIHVDKVSGFEKDPRTSKFEMRGHADVATISGPYQVSGKVLLLPITGRGSSEIKFVNTKLKVSFQTHVDTRNGKDFLSVDRVIVKMDTKKLQIKLENLFNHKELSDSMNAILNENDELIFKELQVPLENVLENVAMEIVRPVFDKFPYSEMFLED